jgi:predicted MPP superfamily phosphohydrolase
MPGWFVSADSSFTFGHSAHDYQRTKLLIMKRRIFLAGVLADLVLALGCWTVNADPKVVHLVNSRNQSTAILLPGATNSLKVMHITDTHISVRVEQEAEMIKHTERMHNAYAGTRKHYTQAVSKTTFQYLDEVLQRAKKEKVELVLLTGDIVNFPSPASVEYVCDRLKQTGIPWLYIAGNHDWHYEGLEGTQESLRKTWIEKSLLPLYQGRNPLFYSEVIKGINFIGIDNSTIKVSPEQTEFLKAQLARPEPIIVFSHIPYSFNGEGKIGELVAFSRLLKANSDQVIGIFAGHIHQATYSFCGNMCQYVSLPGFEGASFVAEIKPAPEATTPAGE